LRVPKTRYVTRYVTSGIRYGFADVVSCSLELPQGNKLASSPVVVVPTEFPRI